MLFSMSLYIKNNSFAIYLLFYMLDTNIYSANDLHGSSTYDHR